MESLPPYVIEAILRWLPDKYSMRVLMTCKSLYKIEYTFEDPVEYLQVSYCGSNPHDYSRILRTNNRFARIYMKADPDDIRAGGPDCVNDLRIRDPIEDSIDILHGISNILSH